MSAPDADHQRAYDALRWLRYAREDLRAAELLLDSADVAPRNSGYLAQQAAEKALKSVFVFLGMTVPRLHDLDALRIAVPDGWRVRELSGDLAALTDFAVAARYPDDEAEPTRAETAEAVAQARAVLDTVVRDLAARGFDAMDDTDDVQS